MSLKLMYITNDCDVAQIADDAGVDRIFIDLEKNGKAERQPGDTVKSNHEIKDISRVKGVLKNSELLVRVNPMYEKSEEEINAVIEQGADIVMLPFFKTEKEVKEFIRIVNKRVRVCLLCETPEAVEVIDEILNIDGIDEIHIGLNDLHLGYKLDFMFELLTNGTVEMLCNKFKAKGIEYGFGGIARVGFGELPAEHIMSEHYRLGSSMVILSRSFCNTKLIKDKIEIEKMFVTGVKDIRDFESKLKKFSPEQYRVGREIVEKEVNSILLKKGINIKGANR